MFNKNGEALYEYSVPEEGLMRTKGWKCIMVGVGVGGLEGEGGDGGPGGGTDIQWEERCIWVDDPIENEEETPGGDGGCWYCDDLPPNSGGTSNPNPDPDPKPKPADPCELLKALGNNSTFTLQMEQLLKAYSLSSKEAGVLMYRDDDGFYKYPPLPMGIEDACELPPFSVDGVVDGVLHAHATGCYPIFSIDDIGSAIYSLYRNGNIRSSDDFIFAVTSWQGSYILHIADENLFQQFGENLQIDIFHDVYQQFYENKSI